MGIIGSRYKPNKSKLKSNNIEIVIVSIANERVKNSLFKCIRHTSNNFPNISISIIIDEGAKLTDSLSNYNSQDYLKNNILLNTYKGATNEDLKTMKEKGSTNLVVVPKNYRPDLIAKGRAIN